MAKDKSKQISPENLVKSSSTAPVELSETELDKVAGGRKAGGDQQDYLKITLTDAAISG
jgi:hypothetical protein